jgi:hypothetical protein
VSRTVDLFLDSDQPLGQLAVQLSDLTGLPLVPVPDRDRFVIKDGEVVLHLTQHDFLDDDGLPLSEFRFVLSASVRHPGDIEASSEIASLRRVGSALRAQGALPSLLVIDLERPDGPLGTSSGPTPGGDAAQ